MIINRWRISCTTGAKHEYWLLDEAIAEPTTCPVDSGHTIDSTSTTIIEVVDTEAAKDEDGQLSVRIQAQTLGFEVCDRDFRINTCKMAQADSVEDLKIDPVSLKELIWAGPELSLVGVYKDDTGNPGDRIPCVDQADADTNGILSIFEYKAINQADGTTEVKYNVLSGALTYDPAIPAGERFDHRFYAIVAPDLGQANFVRPFDGYVAGRPSSGELDIESMRAMTLDPNLATGANVVRFYIYHPAGQTNAHILWLKTYRPAGTF